MASKKYKCPYCGKEFTKERTLQVHMCEPKRRYLQKDEKWVVNAFMVFQRFYQIHQKNSKTKTYDDFVGSPYYNAFVKFGKHIIEIKAINPSAFINYVLKKNVKLDRYCRDENYQNYLEEHLKTETWQDAIARSLKTMESWADENGVH